MDTRKDSAASIRPCSIVDDHAHNICFPHDQKSGNLFAITSEAPCDALEDMPTSLAHLRAELRLGMDGNRKELSLATKVERRQMGNIDGATDWSRLVSELRYSTAYLQVCLPFIEHHCIRFVFIQWLDYTGQIRARCLPACEFTRLLDGGGTIRISKGTLGTLQNDDQTSVCDPVGAILVEPDKTFASLKLIQDLGPLQGAATIMARFTDEEGTSLRLCPRSQLGVLLETFELEHGVNFLVGFEIEITFCRKHLNLETGEESFTPLDTTHAWGTFSDEQYTQSFNLILLITTALQRIGIRVLQLHSETGPGQYEFVLPPLPPIEAIDTLIQARQCIQQIAANKGLRATLHPQPFPGSGTAAHAHISFNRSKNSRVDLETLQMCFMASVLEHLPGLCAMTMPQAVSYARVAENSWTGGTWVAWGSENREVPIRKSDKFRWEIRCLDGCANMYLALTAVLAVGLSGVRAGKNMVMKDCQKNPAHLSSSEKELVGITKKLPTRIEEAVEAAEKDAELDQAMPEGMLKHFLAVKKEEQNMLNDMDESARRVWLMERY